MQARVVAQRCLQQGIGGQEEDDELWGGHVGRPVLLARELCDVGAHVGDESAQLLPLQLRIVGGGSVEESLQRRFRIDVDTPIPGQVHRHVGSLGRAVGGGRRLGAEVAVVEHPGQFRDPLQLHLTPRTTYLGPA